MIVSVAVSFIIILVVSGFYKFYLRPSRQIKRLVREFREKGLRVLTFPFNPLDLPMHKLRVREGQEGDPFKSMKTKFVDYDLIVGNIFASPAIIAISPHSRKQFAKNEVDFCYKKLPFFVNKLANVLGMGIIFSEGNEWKRKRRICSSLFTYQYLNNHIPKIIQICQDSMDQIEKKSMVSSTEHQQQFKFNLFELTSRIFSNVVLSLFLGTQSLQETIQGQKICHFFLNLAADHNIRTNHPLPLLLGADFIQLGLTSLDRDLKRRNKLFNDWAGHYIETLIQKFDQNKDPNNQNLIELLMKSNYEDKKYSKQELIDELKIFLFAGTDTTAHLLEMMVYFTCRNKDVQRQAREEINGLKESISNPQGLKKLKFIEALQKQTLRHYGPLPLNLPRVAVKQHLFEGVRIEKGITIQYYAVPTHYDPKIYPEPFVFKPERWIKEHNQSDASHLTGFSMGPRSCIGQLLAYLESKIAFFMFLKRYSEVEVPDTIRYKLRLLISAENLNVKVTKKC